MIILMHIEFFCRIIIGHGILTYVIGEYLISYMMLVCMGHMMIYLLKCKKFHDSLMRYLLDVHLYDVVMYFHDLYFVLMMFGRVQYKKWDPGISWFHLTWSSSSIVGLRKKTNLQLFEFIFVE